MIYSDDNQPCHSLFCFWLETWNYRWNNGKKKLFFFALARFSQRLFREIGVLFFQLYSFTHPIFIDPHLASYICFWNMFSGIWVKDIIVINENIHTAWQTVHSLCSKENTSQTFQKASKKRKIQGDIDAYGLGISHCQNFWAPCNLSYIHTINSPGR